MTDHTYRVTEIVGSSPDGIEPAISSAVTRASQTLRHLDWFEVVQVRGQITEGQVEPHRGESENNAPGLPQPGRSTLVR